jgi:hypothetical protein
MRQAFQPPRAGLTLVELLLALGLFSLLSLAVFQLFDRSLTLWDKGEVQRGLLEQASTVGELLADDLRAVEGGARGDLLIEWVGFDTDGDGLRDARWPRIRLVRRASAAELARLAAGRAAGEQDDPQPEGVAVEEISLDSELVEVLWCVSPASTKDADARAEGVLWRGERRLAAPGPSLFEPRLLPPSGVPPPGVAEEVASGLLWLQPLCAAQTSVVHDGWRLGGELACAASSWDARGLARPDPDVDAWNEAHPGMPRAEERALLPRRVRLVIEVERAEDRRRRTRLASFVTPQESVLQVEDGRRVPREPGSFVLLGAEWMEVVSAGGDRVQVRRGARGTAPRRHAAGTMLHHGQRLVREVGIAMHREDWDL